MKKHYLFFLALFCAQLSWAEITSSVDLRLYYAPVNGQSENELRLALQGVIGNHTAVGYKQLGILMQWSDTENADGVHVIDMYTDCTFTTSGAITWSNTSSVGGGMNREHTVPQSWFNENEPMRSDAFHVFPTDCKANGHRSSYLYGECENGSSLSSNKCKEIGRLGSSDWQEYSGTVYEVADEYKGDIARGYFYMATRYAGQCENWSGGAFTDENLGLSNYTAALMLKWHRQDPVSEKELLRNEVIYGNPAFNKSDKKQGNRNPFIDFPELVEYIWGEKKGQSVEVSVLETAYVEEPIDPHEGLENTPAGPAATKILRDGQMLILVGGHVFSLTGQCIE